MTYTDPSLATVTHAMTLLFTRDGIDRWLCLICGREMDLGPGTLVIIEQGDQTATHAGSKGGLRVGAVEVRRDE